MGQLFEQESLNFSRTQSQHVFEREQTLSAATDYDER